MMGKDEIENLKLLVWGTGVVSETFYRMLYDKNLTCNIVGVVDASKKKQGSEWHGIPIKSPEEGLKSKYDRIIVTPWYWRKIYDSIISKYGINSNKIDNCLFLHRWRFLKYYSNYANILSDMEIPISYIKKYPIDFINYPFIEKYTDVEPEVFFDEDSGLYYVLHNEKRMYLSRKICGTELTARRYYKSLLPEQDEASPHRYISDSFSVNRGDYILDAGAAEGIFALDHIEEAGKVYLIEMDDSWIEALEHTFKPYKDKVIIIKGFLGDNNTVAEDFTSIDKIVGNDRLDFVKMDIEGGEVAALRGGEKVLKMLKPRLAVCAYHNVEDYDSIKFLLDKYGYSHINHTDGYLVVIGFDCFDKMNEVPKLVRGVIRAE